MESNLALKTKTQEIIWKGKNTVEHAIPLWRLYKKNDPKRNPYWLCYSIFEGEKPIEEKFSLLERITQILKESGMNYEGEHNDVLFVVKEQWVLDLNKDSELRLNITDIDLIKCLEYEEVIESIAHPSKASLWEMKSYRE